MYPIYLKAMTEFDSGFDSLRWTSRLIKGAYRFHYLVGGTAPNKLVKRYLEYGSIRSKRNLGRR